MEPRFVHLHVHSEYSLVDAVVRIKPLVKAVAAMDMPALALTDQSNLFALVKFYKAAESAGIKPIIGVDAWLHNPDDPGKPFRLVLLAQNAVGYGNLTRLVSRGYQEGQQLGVPRLERGWIEAAHAGLIVLSGAREGDVGQALLAGRTDRAEALLDGWMALLGDRYYLEVVRTGREQEEDYLHQAVALAIRKGAPVVASNDVRFLKSEEFEAHEARVCIHESHTLDDPRRPRRYSPEQYLRSPAEMAALFADLPEALENSLEIARRCSLEITLGKNYLPQFPIPPGLSLDDYLRRQARQGLEQRLARNLDPQAPDYPTRRRVYEERLEWELGTIIQMGFPGYFLIVADFIQWAKDQGIPVGPGRGSGAGSLVAYALKITDLDPLPYDLLFERFLNPERVSMPDFDVDFCMEGRDRVIDYVADRYGRDAVSQIITYGSMAAKAVVRDVGRVLGHPYGFVDRIAKLIPFEIGMTLNKALEESEDLSKAYRDNEDVTTLIDMARSLEGLARNAGKHAGGVVIAPGKLTDFTALYCKPSGEGLVTQFDKDDVEQVGLVKFDFLGLRTLTIIDWALKTINTEQRRIGAPEVDITALPLNDPASFELLKRADTTAVFQLESRGMKELIKKLKPDTFEDIVALVALYRPGPLGSGMVDDFIARKHGLAKVEYPHPSLEPILKPTYGTILYQEQVMQIAQVLAGFSLGGADLLRRAMGKKKAEVMDQQRAIFVQGAVARDVEETRATYIFDLMAEFANYGFNKTLAKGTQIATLSGAKLIEQFRAGDLIISVNQDGSLEPSYVIALHDHGRVPLWEVTFEDGIQEICTLDHKWLTPQGQIPLWKIIQLGEQVWGEISYTESRSCPSKGVSGVHRYDSFRPNRWKRTCHALRCGSAYTQKGQRAFSKLSYLPRVATTDSYGDRQELDSYPGNAPEIFRNRETYVGAPRNSKGARRSPKNLARQQPGGIRSDSREGPCFSKALENGNVAGTTSGNTGLFPQWTHKLWSITQAGRLCQCPPKNCYRSRRTMAFPTDSIRGEFAASTAKGSFVGPRNTQPFVAAHPIVNGMLQNAWRVNKAPPRRTSSGDQNRRLGRYTVFRRPIRTRFLGWDQGYDLEVKHPEHNFLLASGLCCSNSHSAAYALVSFQTAWLKAHHPAAFMAAVLSSDMDNTDKVVTFIEECRQMRLKVQPPDVNRSDYRFTVDGERTVIYGLGAIKGVGLAAIEGILEIRERDGLYKDLFDFCRRIDLRKANRRVLEALIRAGALDALGANRATLTLQLPLALRMAEQYNTTQQAGMDDLFGLHEPSAVAIPDIQHLPSAEKEWEDEQRLQGEKDTLGLYLTGHPIDRFEAELKHLVSGRIVDLLAESVDSNSGAAGAAGAAAKRWRGVRKVVVAGLVMEARHRNSPRGPMGSVLLDDRSGRMEVTVFSELYTACRELLSVDKVLVVNGGLVYDDYRGSWALRAEQVIELEQARERSAERIHLRLNGAGRETPDTLAARLRGLLEPFLGGRCTILLEYRRDDALGVLRFGPAWRVRPTDALLKGLRDLLGTDGVRVVYGRGGVSI